MVILAGGWGSKTGSLSEDVPKPMVKIGTSQLFGIMKVFDHQYSNDFVVSCGVKSNVIKDYFFNFDLYNSDFTQTQVVTKVKLIMIHRLKIGTLRSRYWIKHS